MQLGYYKSMYSKSEFSHTLTYVAIVARRVMDDFGLTDWDFRFNHRKCDLGLCFGPTKHHRGRIELSTYLVKLNNTKQVHDILLHEIAHALAGWHHGHDDVWKAKAREIGAPAERLCNTANCAPPDYRAVCPNCKVIYYRHRQVKHAKRGAYQYCKTCGKKNGRLEFVRCRV
jgi:predicted SprT family Zn-dependent metalloprotease